MPPRPPRPRPARPVRLAFEPLEGRAVPAVFTVTTASDDPADPGTTLREAISLADAAPGADEVRFALPANSTIRLNPNASLPGTGPQGALQAISDSVNVVGPGSGRLAVSGANLVRVFGVVGGAVTISGLTITEGLESEPSAAGGGIYNSADLTLADVAVVNNVASTTIDYGRGGGLFNDSGGTVRVFNSRFANNRAPDGGAIHNRGTLTLTDTDVTSNLAFSPPGSPANTGSGGGVFNKAGGVVTAVNCRFDGNEAHNRGAGIYTDTGRVTVTGGEIANNTVTDADGLGGGVFADNGAALSLTGVAITGNASAADGGGVYTSNVQDSALVRVRLVSNRAGSAGGGLFHQSNNGGRLTVAESLIANNAAGGGAGGVASNNFGSPAVPITVLDGDIVAGNSAPTGAGGMEIGAPSLAVANSAVSDAFDPAGRAVGVPAGTPTGGRLQAFGSGPGSSARVRVVRPGQGDLVLAPFEDSFTGGTRVAVADVNLDGVDDVVVGAGAGGGPRAVVYSGADGSQIGNFFAYEPSFRGGVYVGAGRSERLVNGVRVPTSLLVVGAAAEGNNSGSPRVRAFRDFAGVPQSGVVGTSPVDYFAYDIAFQGGVRVSVADLAGNGDLQILTTPGPSGGPDLRVWDSDRQSGLVPALAQQLPGLGAGGAGYTGGTSVLVAGRAVAVLPDGPGQLGGVFLPDGNGTLAATPLPANVSAKS